MKSRVVVVIGRDIIERTIYALKKLKPKIPEFVSTILIKPNLVEPMPKDSGAITRPEIVEGIIRFFKEKGNSYRIIIGEGSAYPSTIPCFKNAGYEYLKDKYGVELYDLNEGEFTKVKGEYWEFEINSIVNVVDYIISVAVLKEHGFSTVTLTLKNMMGVLKPARTIPVKGYIHKESNEDIWALRLYDLIKAVKPNLAVIDGTTGMYGSHIYGKIKEMNLTIVSEDPIACDYVGSKILGHKEVHHIKLLSSKGLGNIDVEILEYEI